MQVCIGIKQPSICEFAAFTIASRASLVISPCQIDNPFLTQCSTYDYSSGYLISAKSIEAATKACETAIHIERSMAN